MDKKKKNNIYIIAIVILLAVSAGYVYFSEFYSSPSQSNLDKIYTPEDFPNALETMTREIMLSQVENLNKEYVLLRQGENIYQHWINIGLFKKRLGGIEGAKEAWLEAVDVNKNQALAYGNLAHIHFYDFKDYEKAEEYYLKALDLKKDNYNYYVGLADLYRYKMTDKKYQIEDLILEGVSSVGDRTIKADYYVYLAKYFIREGNDADKAKYYVNQAVEKNPDISNQVENLL